MCAFWTGAEASVTLQPGSLAREAAGQAVVASFVETKQRGVNPLARRPTRDERGLSPGKKRWELGGRCPKTRAAFTPLSPFQRNHPAAFARAPPCPVGLWRGAVMRRLATCIGPKKKLPSPPAARAPHLSPISKSIERGRRDGEPSRRTERLLAPPSYAAVVLLLANGNPRALQLQRHRRSRWESTSARARRGRGLSSGFSLSSPSSGRSPQTSW